MSKKTQKLDETAWKSVAPGLVQKSKLQNFRIAKPKLRRILECEICASEYPKVDWMKLISKMNDEAKKNGHSTELYEHWLNNRDGTSHGHFQTLTVEDVQEMWDSTVTLG